MAQDDPLPTGTTEEATGTTAQAADGSAPSADGSGGGETIEQLRARLQETERQKAQLLAEKSNVEREREALRQQRDSRAFTPPTAQDPYVSQMQMLQATIARYGSDSYEGQVAIAQAHALESARQAQYATHFMVQVEKDLLRVPQEHRDEVKLRMLNGEFDSVAQAFEMVKGARSSQTVEALQRELAELKAQVSGRPAPKTADVSTSIRTQVDAATHKRNISLTEYQRVMDAGGPQASRLMQQVDNGEVSIDY